MALPAAVSPSPGDKEKFVSQLEETDRYFSRRRQQLASMFGVSLEETETGSPRLTTLKRNDDSPSHRFISIGPEAFPSPFVEEMAGGGSSIAKEFEEIFTQAEGEIDGLVGRDKKELRGVIAAQKQHIEALQGQIKQQNRELQQQRGELQQQKAEAADACSMIEQQKKQLEELRAQVAAAAAAREEQARRMQEQRRRVADLEEQLEKCCATSKEAAALHKRDSEQLQQLRRQQNSLARQVRLEKSGESAAREAAASARHAAELRKVAGQRDTLLAVVKKQFQLIEVLKQQKAHLEAARCLQFTEEEFLKIVEAEGRFSQHKEGIQQQQQQDQQD